MKPHTYPPRVALLACLGVTLLTTGCSTLSFMRREAKPAAPAASFTPATVASAEMPPLDPGLLQRPNLEYRLGPGDILELEIVGEPTTRTRTVVGPDGKIYFYVLPGIDVWGLTMVEARERIVQEMQRFVRDPQPLAMTLLTAESQRVWVLGRLNKPGVFPLSGPMTLLEAIAEAGGPAPMGGFATTSGILSASSGRGAEEAADLSRAFVIRQGRLLPIDFQRLLRDGDMSQNIYLQPDDFVYLPSATIGNVHVLGAVNNPRAVEYVNQLTLAKAVADAGGAFLRESHLSQVAIVRGSLSQPKVAIIDLNAVLRGQAPDVVLEPQDIVYVPYTPHRVLTRYINTILDTFVRVVGVNEGARAVGRVTPVGVNVPIGPL